MTTALPLTLPYKFPLTVEKLAVALVIWPLKIVETEIFPATRLEKLAVEPVTEPVRTALAPIRFP